MRSTKSDGRQPVAAPQSPGSATPPVVARPRPMAPQVVELGLVGAARERTGWPRSATVHSTKPRRQHASLACRLAVSERSRPARSPGRAARPLRTHSGARDFERAVVVRKDVKPRSRVVTSRNYMMRAFMVTCVRLNAGQGSRSRARGTGVPPAHHGVSYGRLPHHGPRTVGFHEH